MTSTRNDGRSPNDIRELTIQKDYIANAYSSVLISFGNTKVICTATVEDSVPRFLKDSGQGWVTAEYSMLPAATNTRVRREISKGRQSGRTMEIQRLIGRSLRAAVDLEALGEVSIIIDCDVIQADGGTRTTSITGGMIVLYDAIQKLMANGQVRSNPIHQFVAATSVGLFGNDIYLDLNYEEDSSADVDMNLIMTEHGQFIEIQGTAEHAAFSEEQLAQFISVGKSGINAILNHVKSHLNTTTP